MQHLVVKGLGRRAVAEALAGGIVVQLDDPRKGRFREVSQSGFAGERAPQAFSTPPFCQGDRVSQKKV